MYCTRKLTEQVTWVGGSDRRLALFENLFPVPHGVSYPPGVKKTSFVFWH